MSILVVDIFGIAYEVVNGRPTRIVEGGESLRAPIFDIKEKHVAGGKCRQCNYAVNSDGMHGVHCGHCECCKE